MSSKANKMHLNTNRRIKKEEDRLPQPKKNLAVIASDAAIRNMKTLVGFPEFKEGTELTIREIQAFAGKYSENNLLTKATKERENKRSQVLKDFATEDLSPAKLPAGRSRSNRVKRR